MKPLYSVRKVAKSKKRQSEFLDYAVVYLPQQSPGQRFRYRSLKTVRGWNPAVRSALEEKDRKIMFSNSKDASQREEDFKVFALSCKCFNLFTYYVLYAFFRQLETYFSFQLCGSRTFVPTSSWT